MTLTDDELGVIVETNQTFQKEVLSVQEHSLEEQ